MENKKIVLRIANPATGDPINSGGGVKGATYHAAGGTTIDRDLDIRDRLMELVGKGNILKPEDKAGIYGSLTRLIGNDAAQKLMNHAYIFNTRPDVQKLPVEEKLNAFYDIGSSDPYIKDVLSKTKALGYGVGPGFRTSISQINQQLAGRVPMDVNVAPTDGQKKIMIKVKNQ